MAVKYKRKAFSDAAKGTQGRLDKPARNATADLKRKLMFIYLGIIAFTGFLFIAYAMGLTSPRPRERFEANGRIVEKTIENRDTPKEAYYVFVEIGEASAPNESVVGRFRAVYAYWKSLPVGAPVRVEYHAPNASGTTQIVGITLLAEDETSVPDQSP